jgi:hypothetical protein
MTSLLPTMTVAQDSGLFFAISVGDFVAFPAGLFFRFPSGTIFSLSQWDYFFAFPEGPGPGMSRQKRTMQLWLAVAIRVPSSANI